MIYLVAILVAAGGALIGWRARAWPVLHRGLRNSALLDLEAPLDSHGGAHGVLDYAHIAAAFAAGLWLLRRWRPRSDQADRPAWKTLLIATVAGAGCAAARILRRS